MYVTSILLNDSFWNSLSEQDQAHFTQAGFLAARKERAQSVADAEEIKTSESKQEKLGIEEVITWPEEEINKWVDFYLNKLYEEKSKFKINRDEFVRWFDLMGVQRHLKASGIFARLSHRDQKHNFLKDIPRTLTYIVDLKETYKELQPICAMIEESILPKLKESE